MSIVMETFQDLERGSGENFFILKNEEKEVKAIFLRRKEFSITKVHFAANLLDPNYKGTHLTENEVVELISDIANDRSGVDGRVVMAKLVDYRSLQKIFSKLFVQSAINHTTPTSWWYGLYGSTQLSKLAKAILNLPPPSAAVERSFSKHARVYSLKRNKLTTDRAAKLIYIAHNLKLAEEDAKSTVIVEQVGQPSTSTRIPRETSIQSTSENLTSLSTSAPTQNDSSSDSDSNEDSWESGNTSKSGDHKTDEQSDEPSDVLQAIRGMAIMVEFCKAVKLLLKMFPKLINIKYGQYVKK